MDDRAGTVDQDGGIARRAHAGDDLRVPGARSGAAGIDGLERFRDTDVHLSGEGPNLGSARDRLKAGTYIGT